MLRMESDRSSRHILRPTVKLWRLQAIARHTGLFDFPGSKLVDDQQCIPAAENLLVRRCEHTDREHWMATVPCLAGEQTPPRCGDPIGSLLPPEAPAWHRQNPAVSDRGAC